MSISLPFTQPLWPKDHPANSLDNVPSLTLYRASPEFRTHQFVIVCPGGGYRNLSRDKEGHRPAQLLASHGISAAVLEYRVFPNAYPAPQSDIQRAIRLVRAMAEEWDIQARQIGTLGFSAGGHLAGSAALLPPLEASLAGDSIDLQSCAPHFAALIYPVVTFTGHYAHLGSRNNLLGEEASDSEAQSLSLQTLVHDQAPPFFLFHGGMDIGVPPQNSLLLYQALHQHHIPADLHISHPITHGVGLADNLPWGQQLLNWLDRLKP